MAWVGDLNGVHEVLWLNRLYAYFGDGVEGNEVND